MPEYLQHLITEKVPASLSSAERASPWRESAKGVPHTPPLPDEAVSRASFYDARG